LLQQRVGFGKQRSGSGHLLRLCGLRVGNALLGSGKFRAAGMARISFSGMTYVTHLARINGVSRQSCRRAEMVLRVFCSEPFEGEKCSFSFFS
jgi:hypothetical protein